jgi:FkbM family methyltransferase
MNSEISPALPLKEWLNEAKAAVSIRPLWDYYDWAFDCAWDSLEECVQKRREIWQRFHDHELEQSVVIDWYGELKFHLYLGHDLSRQLFIAGCYEPNSFRILDELLQTGMTVVDIGAHEGLFSLFAAHKVGPDGVVLAVEPSARERSRLNDNVQINGLKQVKISPVAITDKGGSAHLKVAIHKHSGQNTLGDYVHKGVSEIREEEVLTQSLGTLFSEQGIVQADLLKIDAEGSEALILMGAKELIEAQQPIILFEFVPAALTAQKTSAEELIGFLRGLGYRLFQFARDGRLEESQSPDKEELIAFPQKRPCPKQLISRGSLSVARAYVDQCSTLKRSLPDVEKCRALFRDKEELTAPQWVQFIGLTGQFNPDLVIQLGRSNGQLTCALNIGLNELGDHKNRALVSLGCGEGFQKSMLPALEPIFANEWFETLVVEKLERLENYDFEPWLKNANRVLIVWQQYTVELANMLFGYLLPAVRGRNHQLIVHGLTDTRFHSEDIAYGDNGFWSSGGESGAGLQLGVIRSPDCKGLALYDFCQRNKLETNSGDADLHEFFDKHAELERDLLADLGSKYFSRSAHWFSLSLNGFNKALTFPRVKEANITKPKSEALQLESPGPIREEIPCPAHSLMNQLDALVAQQELLLKLFAALDLPQSQYSSLVQIFVMALEFRPDLILEIGRTQGSATCLLTQAAHQLGENKPCEVLSLGDLVDWDEASRDKIASELGDESDPWFGPLTVETCDIAKFDIRPVLESKKRVLIFWNGGGQDVTDWSLGHLMPAIADIEQLVIVNSVRDSRYSAVERAFRHEPSSNEDHICHIGHFSGPGATLGPLIDFLSRNDLTLHSSAAKLARGIAADGLKLKRVRHHLNSEFSALNCNWAFYGLGESLAELTFPVFKLNKAVKAVTDESGIRRGEIPTLAGAIERQIDVLAKEYPILEEMMALVGHSGDLRPNQWLQLFAYTLDFKPDLIIELGRGKGNSTCLFTQAAHLIESEPGCEVLSLCNSVDWNEETTQKIAASKGEDSEHWFKPLIAENCDIPAYDVRPLLEGKQRVLVFWDAHGYDIAEWVLGHVLPAIKDRDHVILMHDMTDTTFNNGSASYDGQRLWRGNNWSGPRVRLGRLDSAVEQAVAITDFVSRNQMDLHSADASLHLEIGAQPLKLAKFQRVLGEPLSLYGHWFYFSLNEAPGEVTFPSPADLPSGSPKAVVEADEKDPGFIMKLKVAGGILLGRVPVDPWI